MLPVDQFQSTPVVFPMLGGGGSIQPFETVRDYENWLARLKVWGDWVDQAIAKIEAGEYGLCESCGEEIGNKRLEARPVAELCIDCKAEQERLERNMG